MLPPVSAISTASTSPAQRDVPAVAQQVLATLAATPDAAVALSLAANSEVEGKLNMLLLGARERMIDSLFAVVDAVSQSLAMQPDAGESTVGYALRLASAVNNLPSTELASVQQQLNAQGQTTPLALVARALQNPAGTEAAQVVAYMEVVRYKEKDLATKAVVASYGQNGGAEEQERPSVPAAAPPPGYSAGGQSKSPVVPASATLDAPALPTVAGQPAEAESTSKPSVSAPLTPSFAPLSQAAALAQTVAAPARLPVSAGSASPQTVVSLQMPEAMGDETTATQQPVSAASQPAEALKQAAAASPAKDETMAAAPARPADTATADPADVPKSVTNPPAAAPVVAISRIPQAAAAASLATQSANTAATVQQQPEAATYQPAPAAAQVVVEAAGLLPAVTVAMDGEIQSLTQLLPLPTMIEEAVAPLSMQTQSQPQQPLALPVGEPLLPVVNGQIPEDVQAVLKVVVDRLVSATGVELLQTMAEVVPVAEKVVAQALVADMLDSAELDALPSPDDGASPVRTAQISQAAAMATESPVQELASLVALNRLAADPSPIAQAMVQQPLQALMPLGVPFAIGQYLPAEDAADENEALHVDRVDAVDDEEHEEQESGQENGEEEEAADENQEAHRELVAGQEEFVAKDILPAAADSGISRPLALPRPAPMEPLLREPAFNLYQRMGGWD